ncbi:glycosyltransferase family 2 protein [Propionivibrio dicarboxylicus]|uniref:Glycosyl transferase family 2 n=1 Tax=Propionivibrio dicarboxylicus TaxID=83767 RepID=A0A1G8DZV8_9RHOO|nr:glycosyltransferase [Propionivibrio dicarboxylicus]SDH63193.1 Glycosyl transferase family 2 [Propionivibrio dicarboxylicus]
MQEPAENAPIVTVALSVFNGGALLESAVRSVVAQTFQDWELLILDDGSTDGAIDRLPQLEDRRIVVVRDGLNKGLPSRLNQAIGMARGRYFARMDHDDLCHPHRFSEQVAFLDTNPQIDLLATECVTMDEEGRINGSLPARHTHEALCARPWLSIPMPHPTWMGRIEWFRKHRYSDPVPYCCDDNELLLRSFADSRFYCLPQQLLAYRVRSHTPWKKLWRTRLAQAGVQIAYFRKRGRWGAALLSLLAALLRIGTDGYREIRFRCIGAASTHQNESLKEKHGEWMRLIEELSHPIAAHSACDKTRNEA